MELNDRLYWRSVGYGYVPLISPGIELTYQYRHFLAALILGLPKQVRTCLLLP